jgi:CRISPR-associated protein Cas1
MRVSVAHRQLVIERPDLPSAKVPIEDLGVLVVDDGRATYTQAAFIECLAAGATAVVTGRHHLPIGMVLPLESHHAPAQRRSPLVCSPSAD